MRPAARSAATSVDELVARDDHDATTSSDDDMALRAQLVGGDRRRAALHHDEPAGVVGQPRRLAERRARRERQRHRRDHGIAGAGDVGDLVGAEDRNVIGRPVRLEERHAAAAARDEHGAGTARARSSSRPARSSTSRSSPIRTPSSCSTSDSFGVHAVMPRKSQQRVARIDEHGAAGRLGAAAARVARAHERRRHQAGAVVGDEQRVGAAHAAQQPRFECARTVGVVDAPAAARSMRTTCCFAECTPPARMRVLVGVR